MYIEVPAPDCERRFEFNPNHYSILGPSQLAALLDRTGFKLEFFKKIDFDVGLPDPEAENGVKTLKEQYYIIVVTKARPLDIK